MVRDSALELVNLADPSTTTEVPELIPSAPALRPADIFSSAAFPGCMAALDIGICSPDASGAGRDCCESMWRKKRDRYGDFRDELRSRNIIYAPLVASCYGRWHIDSACTLERIARQAARRLGVRDHGGILRRAHAAIGVAIWRRAVCMVRACLPQLDDDALQVLVGGGDAE